MITDGGDRLREGAPVTLPRTHPAGASNSTNSTNSTSGGAGMGVFGGAGG